MGAPKSPARIGRYGIVAELGTGGMGVVYAAYDEELHRKVAVKLLHDGMKDDGEGRRRILREAQAMARVSHPNVVSIYEVGEVDGHLFIAMEYVEGMTLKEWQRGERSAEEILRVYAAAGTGLLAAHDAGLVHRDFKPDNVLIGADGRPRVADFGLARSEKAGESAAPPPAAPDMTPSPKEQLLQSPLTQLGVVQGTPAYMSPEQHKGERTDGRSDQWSFCAALYEALYKTPPFSGATPLALSLNVVAGRLRPSPPGNPIPPHLEQALWRGLSVDPAQRFASMRQLLSLLRIDPPSDPTADTLTRRIFALGVGAALLVAWALLTRSGLRGTLTVVHLFLSGIGQLAVGIAAAIYLRRALLRNAFHRGMSRLVLVILAELSGVRAFAVLTGLSLQQTFFLETFIMAGTSATIALLYIRSAWLMVGLCFVAVLGHVLAPRLPLWLFGMLYPLLLICSIMLWSRAAKERSSKDGT